MKLCVIGNSHVGMVRAAARDIGLGGLDITFFAKAGQGIEKAEVRGTVIAAKDPNLRAAQARFGMPEEIDISTFDAAILVAGTASIFSALRILQTHRVSGWPSGQAAPGNGTASPTKPPNKALISEPAFIAALADQARAGYSYRFASAFRQATKVPIFVIPQPFPSERVFESRRPSAFGFLRARHAGEGAAIADCLRHAIDAAFSEIRNLVVLHQPADTVAHGFTTARAFTRDAVRIDGDTAQHAADLLHVGPAYGHQVLARVAAELQRGRAG